MCHIWGHLGFFTDYLTAADDLHNGWGRRFTSRGKELKRLKWCQNKPGNLPQHMWNSIWWHLDLFTLLSSKDSPQIFRGLKFESAEKLHLKLSSSNKSSVLFKDPGEIVVCLLTFVMQMKEESRPSMCGSLLGTERVIFKRGNLCPQSLMLHICFTPTSAWLCVTDKRGRKSWINCSEIPFGVLQPVEPRERHFEAELTQMTENRRDSILMLIQTDVCRKRERKKRGRGGTQ